MERIRNGMQSQRQFEGPTVVPTPYERGFTCGVLVRIEQRITCCCAHVMSVERTVILMCGHHGHRHCCRAGFYMSMTALTCTMVFLSWGMV